MNLPPAPPPAMSVPPAAPAPKKSNALKWILIGCGGVAFIGLLICGGCLLWFGGFAKSVLKVQEDVRVLLENNPDVRQEIGDIKKLDMVGKADDKSSEATFEYRVQGSKGEGTATAYVRISLTKIELTSALFETKDGRSIKLK